MIRQTFVPKHAVSEGGSDVLGSPQSVNHEGKGVWSKVCIQEELMHRYLAEGPRQIEEEKVWLLVSLCVCRLNAVCGKIWHRLAIKKVSVSFVLGRLTLTLRNMRLNESLGL